MCIYFEELEVYDMTWVLDDGIERYRETHYEIELDDFFYLVDANIYPIKELVLHRKQGTDKCNHKKCNDREGW